MSVTPPLFRQMFPEFKDNTTYPDVMIAFWVTQSLNLLNAQRWGNTLDLGSMYFTAHHLALGKINSDTAAAGGTPGKLKGPVSSQSVDKVSSSYDTAAISLTDMGYWGLTQYGLRFYQLGLTMGAGGLQVGGCGPSLAGGLGVWPGLV